MRNIFGLLVCFFWVTGVGAQESQLGDVGHRHGQFHHPYKLLYLEVNGLEIPEYGDKGFRQEDFQEAYKKVYQGGKCNCRSGYCRATDIRPTQYGAESGYDIWLDRQWYPVPLSALQNEKTLSPELMKLLFKDGIAAHGCGFPDPSSFMGMRIECAIMRLPG